MKKIYKITLAMLIISSISTITYAITNGVSGPVKWIYESSSDTRFTGPTDINGVLAYTDTFTGLKWQATSITSGKAWSIDNSYTEPIWNSSTKNYDYPVGRLETDYPAFKYCIDLGYGWRLPTKKEMFSIITDTNSEKNTNGKYTKLESISNNNYWTSTSNAANPGSAWNMYFNYAYLYDDQTYKTNFYTICIHD